MKQITSEQFKSLPTFLIMKAAKPFLPQSHPWKHRKISLADWTLNQTELNRQLNIILWLNTALLIFIIILLIKRG